ncbi:Os05g0194000, partial [Oryza sativa Japonica Group]
SPSPPHPPPPHLPSSRRLPSNLRRRRHDDEPPSPTTGNGANPAFRTPHLRTAYRKPVPPVAATGEGEAVLAAAPHLPLPHRPSPRSPPSSNYSSLPEKRCHCDPFPDASSKALVAPKLEEVEEVVRFCAAELSEEAKEMRHTSSPSPFSPVGGQALGCSIWRR